MVCDTGLCLVVSLLCLLWTAGVTCAPYARSSHGFLRHGPFWDYALSGSGIKSPGFSGSVPHGVDPAPGSWRPLPVALLGSWPFPVGPAVNIRYDPSRLNYYRYGSSDPELFRGATGSKWPVVGGPNAQLHPQRNASREFDFEFELLRYEPTPRPSQHGLADLDAPGLLPQDPSVPVLRELEVFRYSSSKPAGLDPALRKLVHEGIPGQFGGDSWYAGPGHAPFGWLWGQPVQFHKNMQSSRVKWSQHGGIPTVAHTIPMSGPVHQPWSTPSLQRHLVPQEVRGIMGIERRSPLLLDHLNFLRQMVADHAQFD
ncbi:hypothetical protein Z043_111759 [Scleropages formosus]|uniref:Uncharacterized protein n=1 Tax=Scleropages formosus TaxID=113540 RepID=A0A0P7V401_SCLFO|nr:hypothetical protein Z043_111759 [Scleropages formosus]